MSARNGVTDQAEGETSDQGRHDETIEFVDAVIVADLAVDDDGWANVSPEFDATFASRDDVGRPRVGDAPESGIEPVSTGTQDGNSDSVAKRPQSSRSASTVVRDFAPGSDAVDFDTIVPERSDVELNGDPGIAITMDAEQRVTPVDGGATASKPLDDGPTGASLAATESLGVEDTPSDPVAIAVGNESTASDEEEIVSPLPAPDSELPDPAHLGTSPTSAAIRAERSGADVERTNVEAAEPAAPKLDVPEQATVHQLADTSSKESPFGSLDDIILNRRSLRPEGEDHPVSRLEGERTSPAPMSESEIIVPGASGEMDDAASETMDATPTAPETLETDVVRPIRIGQDALAAGDATARHRAAALHTVSMDDDGSDEAETPSRMGPIINYGDDDVSFRDRLRGLYPERQIFYRANGQVRFITLPTSVQVGATATALLLFGWIGFVTVYYFAFEWMMETKGRQAMEAQQAYQSLVQEVGRYNEQFSAAAQKMEGSRQTLAKLVHRLDKAGSGPDVALPAPLEADHVVTTALPPLPDASIEVVKGRWHALADRSEKLESGWTKLEDKVEGIISANQVVTTERDSLSLQVNELSGERSELHEQVRHLKQTLVALRSSQTEILRRVTRNTRDQVIEVEKLVNMTGLDVQGMLEKQRLTDNEFSDVLPEAQGGPFVELASLNLPPDDPLETKVVALDTQMARQHDLQRLVRLLPLASPVDHYRLTSGFGRRRDPIRKRWSQHQGLDLANLTGTPILSPAPGRVVFAGWRGNFGRLIEIDHGLGVRTRYGHLKKIFVKPGQQVGFRHKIAGMGNSGRSTGSHLHYEIRVDGVPMNPINFLRAGKYVFK